MATAVVISEVNVIAKGVVSITWSYGSTAVTGFTNSLEVAGARDITCQFEGVTGGTSKLAIEGSMAVSGPYITLTSASGVAMLLGDVQPGVILQVQERPRFLRARASTVTGGGLPFVHVIAAGFA